MQQGSWMAGCGRGKLHRALVNLKEQLVVVGVLAALVLGFPVAAIGSDISYEYDDLGRVSRVIYVNGLIVHYEYDAAGNRTTKATAAVDTHFSIADDAEIEGISLAFDVTRTGVTAGEDKVAYYTENGSALGGDGIGVLDYQAVSGELTFAAGVTTQSITVPVNDDLSLEYDETFTVVLSKPTIGADILDGDGLGTIINNDIGPTISIAAGQGIEGQDIEFIASLSVETGVPQSVDFATADGTATLADGDYVQVLAGTVTFLPGETSTVARVNSIQDYTFEGEETVQVNLSNPQGGGSLLAGSDSAFGTISELGAAPVFTVAPAANYITSTMQVDEAQFAWFDVKRDYANVASNMTIDISFGGGTAIIDDDYQVGQATRTLGFSPGEYRKVIAVFGVDDPYTESNETFQITLSNPSDGSTIFGNPYTITINDVVSPYKVYLTSDVPGVTEGGLITFTAKLTGAMGATYTVGYTTSSAGRTATAGLDYVATSGTLTFAPGETEKTFTVTTSTDDVYEWVESFDVILQNPSAGIVADDQYLHGIKRAYIESPETPPVVTFQDIGARGEEGGYIFRVRGSRRSDVPYTVNLRTEDGSAVAGVDYTSVDTTVTIQPGTDYTDVTIPVFNDEFFELDETILARISNLIGEGSIDPAGDAATGVIQNDDPAPVFSVDSPVVTEGGSLSFRVLKSGLTNLEHEIHFKTNPVVAASGADYTPQEGDYIFAAGETEKFVTVPTAIESIYESNETLNVALTVPTQGAVVDPVAGTGTGTINNDDPPPTFKIRTRTFTSPEGEIIDIVVDRVGESELIHTAQLAEVDLTAVAGLDFGPVAANSVAFSPADLTKTIQYNISADAVYEIPEDFQITLASVSNGGDIIVAESVADASIINATVGPAFSVNDVSASEGNVITFTVTKNGASSQTHSVSYATATSSAGAGDFTAKSGTLTFTSAQTSQTVTVTTTEDTVYENNETLKLNLSAATNSATISDSQGIGTIANDDAAPYFTINNKAVSEGGILNFTVTKTGSTAKTHNVNYATAPWFAGTGDYTTKSGTLSFTASQTGKTVSIQTTEEGLFEINERMKVNLSSATNGATISDSQGIGTINNDDAAPVANNDSYSYDADTGWVYLNLTANDTDADGQSLTITSITAPNLGEAVIFSASTVKYRKVGALVGGTATFNYTISDGNLGTDTGTVTVNVIASPGDGGPGAPR